MPNFFIIAILKKDLSLFFLKIYLFTYMRGRIMKREGERGKEVFSITSTGPEETGA